MNNNHNINIYNNNANMLSNEQNVNVQNIGISNFTNTTNMNIQNDFNNDDNIILYDINKSIPVEDMPYFFCTKCNNRVIADSKFCSSCGNRFNR